MMSDVVALLPKVPLSYSRTVPGTSRTDVLVRAACTESVRELVLVVRFHTGSVGPTATFDIVVVAAAPTQEQPEVDYAGIETLASVSLSGAKLPGRLYRAAVRTPLPSHVQVQARVAQPVLRTTIEATVAIELTGKH